MVESHPSLEESVVTGDGGAKDGSLGSEPATDQERLTSQYDISKASTATASDYPEESKEPAAVDNDESWKDEHRQKCEVFNEWCRVNGVQLPKIDYPGYFKGGLVGMKAREPIAHRESFISIPYKMLMTVDGAKRH